MSFEMPDKNTISGLIDAGDVEACLALWELAEEAALAKTAEIDKFKEAFEELERQFKKDLRAQVRELAAMKFNVKKLDSARFAAGRRQKIADGLAGKNR